ncbi:MAG: glycosyltransferase family 4 protein [Deltaproteobacteria bacterium]|nr:glycosyltransferase family 4 protein [Deltaproteobacteria bacterium]
MKSLNILHTVEFYAPHIGGAEKVVQGISEELVKRGHRVTVATTKNPERPFFSLNGVEIVGFDIRGNLANGFSGGDIHSYLGFLQHYPADVVMNYAAQQWATDLAFHLVGKKRHGRAYVIAPCGYSALKDVNTIGVTEYTKYYNTIVPGILPLYDAAIYHSSIYQDYQFAKKLALKNSFVIPNFVDGSEFQAAGTSDFRAKYQITTPFLLLSVGNFVKNKGQDKAIETIKALRRSDVTLVLIGNEGEMLEKLRQQAEGTNTRFLTNIPRADTVAAFKSADLFLFGSRVEAAPLVILEAMAAGLPFVSTDCGNVRELSGGAVCIPEDMADFTQRLLEDAPARRDFGSKGRKEFEERFTLKAVVDRYESLYYELVDIKTPKSVAA